MFETSDIGKLNQASLHFRAALDVANLQIGDCRYLSLPALEAVRKALFITFDINFEECFLVEEVAENAETHRIAVTRVNFGSTTAKQLVDILAKALEKTTAASTFSRSEEEVAESLIKRLMTARDFVSIGK